jgi:DNA polymerase (family X)
MREDRGELEAARKGELPELVSVEDIRGDLHCHTTASDGRNSIDEMARAAIELGYEYLAITDHSATHGFGNDVQADELLRHAERIREVGAGLDGFTLLAGSEVNILPDGSLDYPDDVLEELDWVVASIHTSFRMKEEEMTGRKIELRDPYALNVEKVVDAALRTGTFLEINSNPDRRDLNEQNARLAAEAGVTLMIDSDAHGIETLAYIRYGVATARRGWVTAGSVGNTRPWKELDRMRKRGSSKKAKPKAAKKR